MTHDELLARINKEIQPCGTHTHSKCKSKEENLPWRTLRAVVELHKLMLWKNLGNDTDGYKCEVCEGNSYPCTTIKAIEKELG